MTIDNVLVVLREQLVELDLAVEQAEKELAEARGTRNRVASAVRALDPPPPAPPKKKPGTTNAVHAVAESSLQATIEWLRDPLNVIADDGDVWVTRLVDNPNFTALKSEASVRNAVNELHERGILALDRVAQGGRRIYKVVTE